MIYAKVNAQNEVTESVVSKVELSSPWILVEEDRVESGWIYNSEDGSFTPPQ